MLDKNKILILKNELDMDPLNKGYYGKDFFELLELLVSPMLIANQHPIEKILYYNINNSSVPIISVTDFLNVIPFTELLAIKTDTFGIGLIFYERLNALETKGSLLDVTHISIKEGVSYCYQHNLISNSTRDKLIGTYLVDDPTYQEKITINSRAQDLSLHSLDLDDLKLVKSFVEEV